MMSNGFRRLAVGVLACVGGLATAGGCASVDGEPPLAFPDDGGANKPPMTRTHLTRHDGDNACWYRWATR